MKLPSFAEVRKGAAAAAGLIAEAVTLGVVPEADQKWSTLAIAVLTAVSVFVIPNAQAKPSD